MRDRSPRGPAWLVISCTALLVVVMLVPAVAAATPRPASTGDGAVAVADPFGFCHAGYSTGAWEYDLLDALGSTWMRVDFSWSRIEPEEGVFDFTYWDMYVGNATLRGLKIMAILDYTVSWVPDAHQGHGFYLAPANVPYFLAYVNATVTRYKDQVAAFEIWNEPDAEFFWNGPRDDFFYLFNETATLIHSIDPDITIVGGSVTGNNLEYINAMFDANIMTHVDVISFHPYSSNPNLIHVQVLEIQALARSRSFTGEFWITEVGNPTGGLYGHAVTEEELPSRVVKTLVHSTILGVSCIIWYCLFDSSESAKAADPLNAEYYFGLVLPNMTWKAGAHAFRAFSKAVTNSSYLPGGVTVHGFTLRHAVNAFLYQRENGETTLVTWKDPTSTFTGPLHVSMSVPNVSVIVEQHVDREGTAQVSDLDAFEITLQPRVITYVSDAGGGPVTITGPESPATWVFLGGVPAVGVLFGLVVVRARHGAGKTTPTGDSRS